MLYKIMYPLYRIEAESAKKAKLYAQEFLAENLELVRVEPAPKSSLFKMFLTGH